MRTRLQSQRKNVTQFNKINNRNASRIHPSGVAAEIVGIKESIHGMLCEEHTVCGTALQLNAVVCLCVVQVITSNGEETVIAAY
jgi:hypothetical protein